MNTYLNRWSAALGWLVLMVIVWTVFVPTQISVTTFVTVALLGLITSFFGVALVQDSQPPRSIGQILSEIEAGGAPPGSDRRA